MKRIQKFYSKNIFSQLKTKINHNNKEYQFYSMKNLKDDRVDTLPYSVRILLENSLRNNDNFVFTEKTTECILDWKKNSQNSTEIPFKPSRVLL